MIRAVIIMKFWKKTLPFILLNIIVSAATLLAVLYFWQQRNPLHKAEPTQPIITPIEGSQAPSRATPTAQILEDRLLRIEGVFGVGIQAIARWISLAGGSSRMVVGVIASPI